MQIDVHMIDGNVQSFKSHAILVEWDVYALHITMYAEGQDKPVGNQVSFHAQRIERVEHS